MGFRTRSRNVPQLLSKALLLLHNCAVTFHGFRPCGLNLWLQNLLSQYCLCAVIGYLTFSKFCKHEVYAGLPDCFNYVRASSLQMKLYPSPFRSKEFDNCCSLQSAQCMILSAMSTKKQGILHTTVGLRNRFNTANTEASYQAMTVQRFYKLADQMSGVQ